ncbi:MAG: alpha-L-rhamnosidase C-terminal domain-containing protein [Planctomycetota bacterium]
MYDLVGDDKRYRKITRWAERLRANLKSLIGNDGLMCDGLTWKGKVVSSYSIHAQTLAIAANLSPATEEAMLKNVVLPYVRGETNPEAEPSAYWITYVFTELICRGYGADVVECIRRRWLPMAEFGTTWEKWQKGCGSGSCSHAWSAHPLYHLMNTVGGVRQSAAGWREVQFEPIFIGTEGGATVPTPQGEIISHWRKQANSINIELSLPTKVIAKVRLPGAKKQTVKGKAKWMLPLKTVTDNEYRSE